MPFGFMFMQLIFFALPIGTVAFFGWLGLRYIRARERDVDARVESVSGTGMGWLGSRTPLSGSSRRSAR